MQKVIVITLWALFSLLFQSVVATDFPSVHVWTDFIFYLIIILGLRFGLVTGVGIACLLGYVADAASMAPYGTAMISYVLTLLVIRRVKANIYIENRSALFFWILVFSAFKQMVQIGYLSAGHWIPSLGDAGMTAGSTVGVAGMKAGSMSVVGIVLINSLWSALLGVLLVPLLQKLLFTDWGLVFRRGGLRD